MRGRTNPRRDFVVGVDLGGTNLRAAAVSRGGTIISLAQAPTGARRGSAYIMATLLRAIARAARVAAREGGGRMLAVGVGVPGPVDLATGVVHDAPNIPAWRRYALRRHLGRALPVPVVVENDANAAALGELWRGAGRGVRHLIVLTLGTGVGGGVVVDGRILHGARGMAGELGHVVVEADGAPCGCGGRGCLEAYASATGIGRLLRERLGGRAERHLTRNGTADVASVVRAAAHGDRDCRAVLATAGTYLGVALASFVNLFNPEVIAIGGGIAGAWTLLVGPARRELRERAFPIPQRLVRIRRAALGNRAGVLGAAHVAWAEVARELSR